LSELWLPLLALLSVVTFIVIDSLRNYQDTAQPLNAQEKSTCIDLTGRVANRCRMAISIHPIVVDSETCAEGSIV
jgi:hypothetical protein